MREEGEGKRQEKQESLYTQNPSSNIRITNASITFHQVQGYLAKGRKPAALTKQVRSEARGRCGVGSGGGLWHFRIDLLIAGPWAKQ